MTLEITILNRRYIFKWLVGFPFSCEFSGWYNMYNMLSIGHIFTECAGRVSRIQGFWLNGYWYTIPVFIGMQNIIQNPAGNCVISKSCQCRLEFHLAHGSFSVRILSVKQASLSLLPPKRILNPNLHVLISTIKYNIIYLSVLYIIFISSIFISCCCSLLGFAWQFPIPLRRVFWSYSSGCPEPTVTCQMWFQSC